MNIADELLKGLILLKDVSKFSNPVFQEIVNLSFEILVGKKSEENLLGRYLKCN
jgi:hypothetical protein